MADQFDIVPELQQGRVTPAGLDIKALLWPLVILAVAFFVVLAVFVRR
jgi:hypothetical protein